MDTAQRSRWMAWAVQAALGVLLAGCGGGAQGGANAPEVDLGRGDSQGVRTLPADGGEGRASGEGAARKKVAPLPAEFSALGKECPASPAAAEPGQPQPICGRDKRIAALWKMSMGPAPALPEPVIRRAPSPSTPTVGGFAAASVHLDREHLWIASACMECRIPSESLWIGDLSLVTDEQIGMVQMQMGIPQKPALRDEASWRAALAKATPGD